MIVDATRTPSDAAANTAVDAARDDAIDELIAFLREHRRIFVLGGAGCSTESGIPDYRDQNGAWKRRPPVTWQAFQEPATRSRYWARNMLGWPHISAARPSGAHRALARLEAADRIEHLVTQNVDGLHQAAGSERVIDLHGRMDRVICLGCRDITARTELQPRLLALNPDWAHLSAGIAPDGDADLEAADFSGFVVPDCTRCGGMLKPDVVFFGENVPPQRVTDAMDALARADAVLVAGSSLTVFSGYRFVLAAARLELPVAAVNRGLTRADALLAFKVEQSVGEALTQAVDSLGD